MLVEQIAMAHHAIGCLYVRAATAETLDQAKLYNAASFRTAPMSSATIIHSRLTAWTRRPGLPGNSNALILGRVPQARVEGGVQDRPVNLIRYTSREEAVQAGKRPCAECQR